MDQPLKYVMIGSALLSGAVILICAHWRLQWNRSQQKWKIEALKFWNNLQELNLDPETIRYLMRKMKTTEDFENANRSISKGFKKPHVNQII